MFSQEAEKRLAAARAVDEIEDGMFVGLGTGSTTAYAIKSLSDRIRQGLRITAVATSRATEMFARRLAVPLVPFEQFSSVDLTIDGADEIDHQGYMVKGGGAALTREKITAAMSEKFVCIADESKLVGTLGAFPLPVEVIPMARSHVARQLVKLGGDPVYREGVMTDNGNIILDVFNLEILDPVALERDINAFVGVVTNGLFAARPADLLLLGPAVGVRSLQR